MAWDLDEILEVAGADRHRPQLIEVGRALIRGRVTTTGYFWSNGRIGASVGGGNVRIARRLGATGDGVRLRIGSLPELVRACAAWARSRHEWAAFYCTSAGYPPGFGGHTCYYQAPGKRSERVTVKSVGCLGRNRSGEDFVGMEARVHTTRACVHGASITQEIWRRGEKYGPPDGSLVGMRFRIDRATWLDAWRNEARVSHRGGHVWLEPGDERFVAALQDVVTRSSRGKR